MIQVLNLVDTISKLQNYYHDNKFNTIQCVKLKTCIIRSNMHVYICIAFKRIYLLKAEGPRLLT